MRPDQRQYVEYRLARAQENESLLLLQSGHRNTAVSRAYYACFYAVSGLLWAEGYSSSKHAGVIALFDQYWMKPERLPRELSRTYHGLFERRQEGDYGDGVVIEQTEAEEWLAQAEQFVRVVSEKTREVVKE